MSIMWICSAVDVFDIEHLLFTSGQFNGCTKSSKSKQLVQCLGHARMAGGVVVECLSKMF